MKQASSSQINNITRGNKAPTSWSQETLNFKGSECRSNTTNHRDTLGVINERYVPISTEKCDFFIKL